MGYEAGGKPEIYIGGSSKSDTWDIPYKVPMKNRNAHEEERPGTELKEEESEGWMRCKGARINPHFCITPWTPLRGWRWKADGMTRPYS